MGLVQMGFYKALQHDPHVLRYWRWLIADAVYINVYKVSQRRGDVIIICKDGNLILNATISKVSHFQTYVDHVGIGNR